MIEHRRASQPSFSSVVVPPAAPEPETLRNLPQDNEDEDERRAPVANRSTAPSDVFLKAR